MSKTFRVTSADIEVFNFSKIGIQSLKIPTYYFVNVRERSIKYSLRLLRPFLQVYVSHKPSKLNNDLKGQRIDSTPGIYIKDLTVTGERKIRAICSSVMVNKEYSIYSGTTVSAQALVLSKSLDGYSIISATRTMKIKVIQGRYNDDFIKISEDEGFIVSTENLFGLKVNNKKNAITGIVGFTEEKIIKFKTSKGVEYIVFVIPTILERIF